MAKLIFHVDENSAFLSWEAARRVANGEPDIRLIPSVIGGDREKRSGVVLAKSIPAKKFGIKTGEPIGMALRKCPDLFMAKPNFRLYEENSRKFMDICREYAPVVEKVRASGADLLFVCLGAPKQELWMEKYGAQTGAHLMMGLGGSLDVWAGTVQRAPEFYIDHNLKWFYRLIKNPSRAGRMMKLPLFLVHVVFGGKRKG